MVLLSVNSKPVVAAMHNQVAQGAQNEPRIIRKLSTTSTVIQSHPTNGIPDPQTKLYTEKKTYQEHPHTAPTTFDTPSNKPR